jgi:IS4 transposase
MFKRLKQNFLLKYFLGDKQNAIEIQIWTALIVQLIMLVIQRKFKRNKAKTSNLIKVDFFEQRNKYFSFPIIFAQEYLSLLSEK